MIALETGRSGKAKIGVSPREERRWGIIQGRLGTVLDATALPSWLALWIDPAWLQSIHAGLVATIEGVRQIMPWLAAGMAWLSPLLWTVWALGALSLLIITAIGHRLLGSFFPANRPSPPSIHG